MTSDSPKLRAERVYRQMLLAFGLGYAVIAVVGGLLTGEVGIVVLFALIYGFTVVIARWGLRLAIRDIDQRKDVG